MDVVYIHKQKHSEEILWSIRSVKQNLKHRNIYVIGDDPGIAGVTVVEPKRNYWARLSKYHDQVNKYLTACGRPEISEEFIAMNDDFFIMATCSPENYNRGTLKEHVQSRTNYDSYRRSLGLTAQYLESVGKQTLSFELHTPMIFEKQKLSALINSMDISRNRAYQIRSLYGNMCDVPSTFRSDVKNIPNFAYSDLLSTTEYYFGRMPIGRHIRAELS